MIGFLVFETNTKNRGPGMNPDHGVSLIRTYPALPRKSTSVAAARWSVMSLRNGGR